MRGRIKFKISNFWPKFTTIIILFFQWMLGNNGRTFFSGSIGKDKFANLLLQKIEQAGIDAIFYEIDNEATGTCASLINGKRGYRSLVTNLAAAKSFKKDHLERGKILKISTL